MRMSLIVLRTSAKFVALTSQRTKLFQKDQWFSLLNPFTSQNRRDMSIYAAHKQTGRLSTQFFPIITIFFSGLSGRMSLHKQERSGVFIA
jgi:hypothetical protein